MRSVANNTLVLALLLLVQAVPSEAEWGAGRQAAAAAVRGNVIAPRVLELRGGWNLFGDREQEGGRKNGEDGSRIKDAHPRSSKCSVAKAIRNAGVAQVPKGLSKVLTSIGNAVEGISDLLSKGSGTKKETGTTNTFGDSQLEIDILADDVCFRELKKCVAVCMASSEETSEEVFCSGRGYSVAFDPLDGSSIIDANWAVGSIFGVYPDPSQKGFIGRRGRDQCAAVMAIYGPRTTLAIGLRLSEDDRRRRGQEVHIALEVALTADGWVVTRSRLEVGEGKKVFAPGNLRASQDRSGYAMLLNHYLASKYTLRYTGGMVPDVYYILIAGGGVFCNPSCPAHKQKLRLLYECAPIAMIVECAGGLSSNGKTNSILDVEIASLADTTDVCVGSPSEVRRYRSLINAPNPVGASSAPRRSCLPFWPLTCL